MRLDDFVDSGNGVLVPPASTSTAAYADGAEAELLGVMNTVSDHGSLSQELRDHVHDWPSLYHLSPYRWTILDCLGFTNPDSRVLELGAGCGAVTRWLGERVQVDAVEGSYDRATVARRRCGELESVRAFVANIYDLDEAERYDVATLIGVLEYAHTFHPESGIDAARAADTMLRIARRAIAPGGVLIVAIENKLGLKYFSGACEDHSSRPYDGLVGYPGGSQGITWSRYELEALLHGAGFADVAFFLPFPDYKLASTILSADQLDPSLGLSAWIETPFPDRVRHTRPHIPFNESLALAEVERAGLLADLANSFVAVAYTGDREAARTRAGIDDDWVARHYSLDRHTAFCKRVTLPRASNAHVVHEPVAHGSVDAGVVTHRFPSEPRARGELLVAEILRAATRGSLSRDLPSITARLRELLTSRFGTGHSDDKGAPLLTGDSVDVVPWNVVVSADGSWTTIDLEWTLGAPLPVDFVLWRGLHYLADRYAPYFRDCGFGHDDVVGLGLGPISSARLDGFRRIERAFQVAAGAVPPAEQHSEITAWGGCIPSVHELLEGGTGTDPEPGFTVLAWASELEATPELLQAFAARCADDAISTLAILAPGDGVDAATRLEPPVVAAGLEERVVILPADGMRGKEGSLAARVDAILTAREPAAPFDALPRLELPVEDRSPRFELAICTIVRNEAPYLQEWIEFHRLVGVEHFFVYDNRSEDDAARVLAPYIDEGLVTLIPWSQERGGQCPAYTHCATTYGADVRWMAFMDADEFFYSPVATDLREALREFEPYGGVHVNYVNYGTSGRSTRPDGLVIESYLRRAADDSAVPLPHLLRSPELDPTDPTSYHALNAHVSSVVQPARVVGCTSPHYFSYEPGWHAVTENHERHDGPITDRVSAAKLRMNHYWSKSVEECRAKFERGRADTPQGTEGRAWPGDFELRNAYLNDELDDEILVHLPALREALGLPASRPVAELRTECERLWAAATSAKEAA